MTKQTPNVEMVAHGTNPPAGGPVIEITPEMIEAGVYEARTHHLGEPLAELVRKVYVAMVLEEKPVSQTRPQGT